MVACSNLALTPALSQREREPSSFPLEGEGWDGGGSLGMSILLEALTHSDRRAVTVPVHSGRDLGRGILRKILRDAQLSPEEFLEFLQS